MILVRWTARWSKHVGVVADEVGRADAGAVFAVLTALDPAALVQDHDVVELIEGLADLTRHIHARDQHCRFPGCTRPATTCDLDHVTPYPHGPTANTNLVNS